MKIDSDSQETSAECCEWTIDQATQLSHHSEMSPTALRENQRMSMRDLEVLSSIVPITTTSTSERKRCRGAEREKEKITERENQHEKSKS